MKKQFDPAPHLGKTQDTGFLAAAFVRGMAFGKSIAAFQDGCPVMSVLDKEDILLAIRKSYMDMSPRTFKVLERKEKDGNWKHRKEEIFAWLAEAFLWYFREDCPDFDGWHETLCEEFLGRFKPLLQEYGYDGARSLSYGKAQKIVNMTFKYLCCFDDARGFEGKFAPCHMPIDSYILKWYNCVSPIPCKKAWSDLDKEEYLQIQQQIRRILGDRMPLVAEFFIWAEYSGGR